MAAVTCAGDLHRCPKVSATSCAWSSSVFGVQTWCLCGFIVNGGNTAALAWRLDTFDSWRAYFGVDIGSGIVCAGNQGCSGYRLAKNQSSCKLTGRLPEVAGWPYWSRNVCIFGNSKKWGSCLNIALWLGLVVEGSKESSEEGYVDFNCVLCHSLHPGGCGCGAYVIVAGAWRPRTHYNHSINKLSSLVWLVGNTSTGTMSKRKQYPATPIV